MVCVSLAVSTLVFDTGVLFANAIAYSLCKYRTINSRVRAVLKRCKYRTLNSGVTPLFCASGTATIIVAL